MPEAYVLLTYFARTKTVYTFSRVSMNDVHRQMHSPAEASIDPLPGGTEASLRPALTLYHMVSRSVAICRALPLTWPIHYRVSSMIVIDEHLRVCGTCCSLFDVSSVAFSSSERRGQRSQVN